MCIRGVQDTAAGEAMAAPLFQPFQGAWLDVCTYAGRTSKYVIFEVIYSAKNIYCKLVSGSVDKDCHWSIGPESFGPMKPFFNQNYFGPPKFWSPTVL